MKLNIAQKMICLALLSQLMGCGGQQADYAKLGLVEISGTVTLDGSPVEGAAVYFYEPDERYCFGVTDENGKYTMMLNSEKSGVTPGEKLVKITTTSNPLGEAADSGEAEEDPDAKPKSEGEQIPDCYNTQSNLKYTVADADSAVDFELKSDCSTSGAS